MATKYRQSPIDIDAAIVAYGKSRGVPGKGTTYLCRHSTKPDLVAPLKAVMWRAGWAHPSFAAPRGADGGTARENALALGYVEERLTARELAERPRLAETLRRWGVPARSARVMRYVPGVVVERAWQEYIDAELRLRQVLGRPDERREVLRTSGEFLYCRIFGATQPLNQNQPGYDAVFGSLHAPRRRVQVKLARKAASNSAGIWIKWAHVHQRAFDVLVLFWLGADDRIVRYFEIDVDTLPHLGKGSSSGFDLKPEHIDAFDHTIGRRSLAKLRRAMKKAGMRGVLVVEDS